MRDRLFGRKKDGNGVQIIGGGGDPATCAVGFAITKDNGEKELWWLYKGVFWEQEVTAKTGGEKIEYQTPTINGSFDHRMNDDKPGVVVDTDDTGVPEAVITKWFEKVYESPVSGPVEPTENP